VSSQKSHHIPVLICLAIILWSWETRVCWSAARWPFEKVIQHMNPTSLVTKASQNRPDQHVVFANSPLPPKMDDMNRRLTGLDTTIEKIMSIAGTPGLSLGVLHEGKMTFFGNYGLRDVAANLPPTEETIYPGCSLTKALVAATAGILVEEGKLKWDTRVKDVLPDWNISDDTIRNQVTVTDLLSHRAGFSVGD
jgi:CubicO group peptidase (beta-lactamase class C family)